MPVASIPSRTASAGADPGRELRGERAGLAALHDRPVHRRAAPARGEVEDRARPGRLAEDRDPPGIAAECRDVLGDPLERLVLVTKAAVGDRVDRGVAAVEPEVAERAEPVVRGDDDHVALGGEAGTVEHRHRTRPTQVRAAVEPDEHRTGAVERRASRR